MYTSDRITVGSYPATRITDTLADGTVCTVLKPEEWNRVLLLDLDGASNCDPQGPMAARSIARLEAFFSQGYAYGGIQRNAVGYRFPDAVQMLVDVRTAFVSFFGAPEYTIAVGGSRGAFVGRFCMEQRPDVFDGAMVYGGGGSGEIAAINSKLDGRFTLNTLLRPSEPLTLANITDMRGEERKLHDIIDEASKTALGRARLALAAAYEQLPVWADAASERPAADDYEEQFRQLMTCFQFAQFTFGSYTIEQLAGGPFSWNTDTDYEDLLRRSGREAFVRGMYLAAGVGEAGLKQDLDALKTAPRISADAAAVAKAEKLLTYTGMIEGPVVNMENIGDQVDPESCKYAYRKTLEKRGKEDLLRVLWVNSSGHCNFSDAETLEALDVLMDRIKTGAWGDLTPERLNEKAAKKHPSEARFFSYAPAEALHEWDFENWDSYRPKLLVVIDMQNDFIDGSLGTPEAQAIVEAVKAKIRSYPPEAVIATMDTHGPDYLHTQEGRRLPVEHCIKGTDGWNLRPDIAALLDGARIFEKPTFGSVAMAEAIRSMTGVEEIELVGLCTDICVVSNALLLKAAMPEVKISVDASCCAGVTPEKHRAALETMRSCQIEVC